MRKKDLLESLQGRSLVIWGARMTGMGFLRLANKNGLDVLGFVDSDSSLEGTIINGCEVYAPESLAAFKNTHKNICVVVAVALKEDEIVNQLSAAGFSSNEYINFSDFVDTFYTIDIVGNCNLKCPSCAHGMDYDNSRGIMSLKDFQQVTKKMLAETEIVSHVSLYSWGEPFLHPELADIIDHLHDLGVAAAVSTNLSMDSSKQIRKVIKSSPDYLKISLSGFYPEVYNATHTGGDINLVKSNLYKLRYYIDLYKSSTLVDVNYHLYKNNNGKNLRKMRELCDELGFAISTSHALVMPVERVIDHCDGKPDLKTAALSELLLVDIDEGREATKDYRDQPCRFLTNQININWDKSVSLCCVCFERPNSIISDDYLSASRKAIEETKSDHPFCEKCVKYGLPAYNLGHNQAEWKRIAGGKTGTDQ